MSPPNVAAELFDQALMDVNEEYASKRKTGRLAHPEIVSVNYEHLMTKLTASDHRYVGANPAQFKPLPLYKIFWDTLQINLKGGDANG